MHIDPTTLFGGFFFGLIGFAAWRYGRRANSLRHLLLAITLMVFPYFTTTPLLLYGIGACLTVLLFWPKL